MPAKRSQSGKLADRSRCFSISRLADLGRAGSPAPAAAQQPACPPVRLQRLGDGGRQHLGRAGGHEHVVLDPHPAGPEVGLDLVPRHGVAKAVAPLGIVE